MPTARKILQSDLGHVRRHVASGKRCIERQRDLIARLQRNRRDTTAANEFLALLLDVQALHVDHRDRLIKELAN